MLKALIILKSRQHLETSLKIPRNKFCKLKPEPVQHPGEYAEEPEMLEDEIARYKTHLIGAPWTLHP